jgi:hypothetical protein
VTWPWFANALDYLIELRVWRPGWLILAALLVLSSCATNDTDEHMSKQRQVRRLEIMKPFGYTEKIQALELAMISCMHDAELLEIGVATSADLPCKDDDWHVNTTTTAAGITAKYVYPGPNGSDALLYFDVSGKLVAKQWF